MATTNDPHALGPQSILPMLVRSLYDSANTMCQNFGFTIPQLAMAIGLLVAVLILWAIAASFRNRKSFSLEDEEDADVSQSPDRIHGGVLRSESGAEGSQGVLT